jgi:hypothetical protein
LNVSRKRSDLLTRRDQAISDSKLRCLYLRMKFHGSGLRERDAIWKQPEAALLFGLGKPWEIERVVQPVSGMIRLCSQTGIGRGEMFRFARQTDIRYHGKTVVRICVIVTGDSRCER